MVIMLLGWFIAVFGLALFGLLGTWTIALAMVVDLCVSTLVVVWLDGELRYQALRQRGRNVHHDVT
jgi:uncharacterized membrane protein YjgN (DUF898 family)